MGLLGGGPYQAMFRGYSWLRHTGITPGSARGTYGILEIKPKVFFYPPPTLSYENSQTYRQIERIFKEHLCIYDLDSTTNI